LKKILATAKTVRQLLKGAKYSIDYYQREYKWQKKQMQELVEDLCGRFLESYQPSHARKQVAEYGHYFLGSIIVSDKENASFLVDGQQRLTSLSLLLIFLRHRQMDKANQVNIDELIFSEQFGDKSFNLDVPARTECMKALFEGQPFDATGKPESESLQNVQDRYSDIEAHFPDEIDDAALPYFIDWMIENVHLVEITAFSNKDAYAIFETMNDRGLSLTPAEMLKGYLLANIADTDKRTQANTQWKERVQTLTKWDKETDADFFKAWLRSQYATKIRERKKGGQAEDFDLIGTEFHRWLRDAATKIGLHSGDEFYRFIATDFDFYSRHYIRVLEASEKIVPGLERIAYNADQGFTLQPMLLLAPLKPTDSEGVADAKMRAVARFLDILLARRLWNFRSIAYSTMQYAMFLVMREIRGLELQPLARVLHARLDAEDAETFASNDRLRLHQQNRWALHRLLARLTDWVETEAGNASRYDEFVSGGKNPYEVEHIWANKPERHANEFSHPEDFAEQRNRIGGLLLLPKKFNASYGALAYEEKLPHYNTQNLLARSLHELCYTHNPGFKAFVNKTSLPFSPHEHFKKADQDKRSALYQQIAEQIWNPDLLLSEIGE